VRRLPWLPLALAALALATAATAAPSGSASSAPSSVAEVRAHGDLLSTADAGPYAYPDSLGTGIRIGDAAGDARGVELHDVSLLDGRVWAYRVFVPARGLRDAAIESLVIGGRQVAVRPNKVVHLAPRTYIVLLQQAFVPGRRGQNTGVVGIRAYVGDPGFGVDPGTQLLVGLSRPAVPKRPQVSAGSVKGVAGNALLLGVNPTAVEANPPLPLSAPIEFLHPSLGGRAVALAQRYLGIPYVWGGADPATGFDCSGLVMYVYGKLGISLPHFTGSQWQLGKRIAQEDLVPGDIVFFFPQSYGPGHEGLYIGNGRFLHAPRTGDVVKISSLSEAGYAFGYMGAIRPY
jgi:NlpC/P60 family